MQKVEFFRTTSSFFFFLVLIFPFSSRDCRVHLCNCPFFYCGNCCRFDINLIQSIFSEFHHNSSDDWIFSKKGAGLFGMYMLLCGFFVRASNIPDYWIWFHYLVFHKVLWILSCVFFPSFFVLINFLFGLFSIVLRASWSMNSKVEKILVVMKLRTQLTSLTWITLK